MHNMAYKGEILFRKVNSEYIYQNIKCVEEFVKSLCYKIMFYYTNELKYKQLRMFSHVLQMSPKATYPSTILRNQVTAAASSII